MDSLKKSHKLNCGAMVKFKLNDKLQGEGFIIGLSSDDLIRIYIVNVIKKSGTWPYYPYTAINCPESLLEEITNEYR